MKNNNSDRFEGLKKESAPINNDNFFLLDESPVFQQVNRQTFEPVRRLNDYDFNLLKEDAYKDVTDDLFKLEYKISKTADEIKTLESQIQAAFDIHDENLIDELINRKALVEEEYESLVAMYNDKSLSAKISDGIFNLFGEKLKYGIGELKHNLASFSESVLSRMPKRFSSILELKRSLAKLENINKSVDELVNLNIPYGENVDKYEQLSKYIIKANNILQEIEGFYE